MIRFVCDLGLRLVVTLLLLLLVGFFQ